MDKKSKNGPPELISLLQYMKKTTLDNPEILVKDERIAELDKIVQEVKESEEWEELQMSILSIGVEKGRLEGIQKGRQEGIQKGRQEGIQKGRQEGIQEGIQVAKQALRLSAQGTAPEEIARQLGISLGRVKQILE